MTNSMKWVYAFAGLGKGKGRCPHCGSKNLDYGYRRVTPKDDVGYGAVWCKDCQHAFNLSRVELKGKENKIMDDFPKGLVYA